MKNVLITLLTLGTLSSVFAGHYKCQSEIKEDIRDFEESAESMKSFTVPATVLTVGVMTAPHILSIKRYQKFANRLRMLNATVEQALDIPVNDRYGLKKELRERQKLSQEFLSLINKKAKTKYSMSELESFLKAMVDNSYFCNLRYAAGQGWEIKLKGKVLRMIAKDIETYLSIN